MNFNRIIENLADSRWILEKAISVSQLSGYIRGIFEAEELLHNISVYGEISDLSISRGNAYFNLKDEGAILSCVFFETDVSNLKNGDLVTVTGTPKYYVKGGKLNFNVVRVEPFGVGELFRKFLEIKERLAKEGLFDTDRKKPLPKNIRRIGIVTSEKGAVLQDIINITSRRNKSVDLVLYPTRVQGNGADKEIIEGITFFDHYDNVDVIIVARGGGSLEDLMAFNSEALARAVADCKKVVISAVGHETDFTIIDFVADLRAPTPSAAAELAVGERREKINNLVSQFKRMSRMYDSMFAGLKNDMFKLKRELEIEIKNFINNKEYELNLLSGSLKKLNPKNILERGFAKVEINGRAVTETKGIKPQEELEIYLKDGKIVSKVKEVKAW